MMGSSESVVIIENWFGRFSNNLIQLTNACCIAEALGYSVVSYPASNFFEAGPIVLNFSGGRPGILRGRFFTFADVEEHLEERPSYSQMRDVVRRHIREKVVGLSSWSKSDGGKNGAVETSMHVRGGDIFSKRPQPRYVPAPLGFFDFYTRQFGSAGLVYEDTKNPCVNRLLDNDDIVDVSTGSRMGDIHKLGSSDTIVVGPGTFWFSGFLLLDNLKRVVVSVPEMDGGGFHDVWKMEGWPNGFVLIKNFLHGYIPAGLWKNGFFQRRRIVSYDFVANVEIVTGKGGP